jgi:hypothetical protein
MAVEGTMRRMIGGGLVLCVMLSATVLVIEAQKPTVKFREFSSFEVEDFRNETAGTQKPMPDAWIPTLREDIAQRVIELHKFQRVADFEDQKAPKPAKERVLVLKGRITEFTRGNQAIRFAVGFGAGKGKIVAACQFIDKESGQVVWERQVDGQVYRTGESTEGAIQGVSKEIKKVINQNW